MRLLRGAIWSLAIAAPLLATITPAEAATGTCGGIIAKARGGKVILGGPGDDVLIGSGRSQRIFGGAGEDRICAGGGNDEVHGQSGDDTIHGEGRGDLLFGEGGSDRLYGDILDDKLMGGAGADALVGGHGVDRMFGGSGNDLLRGGTNRDCYYGQGGANTASFATATPPGVPNSRISGVRVDLDRPTSGNGGCPRRGSGRAEGDGDVEVLKDIQFVVGSAVDDEIRGRPGTSVDAGLGEDSCTGFGAGQTAGCGGGDEKPAGVFAYVFEPATGAPADAGLIVRAAENVPGESIGVSSAGVGATVTAAGNQLVTGAHCDGQGICLPTAGPLGYVLVYGGEDDDAVAIGDGLFPDTTVDIDGGPGNDTLNGSNSLGEVLLGGDFPGADTLYGNGGGDALVSEGGSPDSGPDLLSGGPGDDQLVADYPCAGHTFSGGSGGDIAGFALSAVGIRARVGGLARLKQKRCPGGRPTTILLDHEVLEGTPRADRLIGSARPETIWGRAGNDALIGNGGADALEGFAGSDLIDARDRKRDREIDCGSGRDRARRDRVDPPAVKC